MAGGRPRKEPSEEEAIELGKDLVKWISEPTDELRTVWAMWYAVKHDILEKDWKMLKQREEFFPYYQKARAYMVAKLHAQKLEKGVTHRYLAMYDRELYNFEDEEADKRAQRAKASLENYVADDIRKSHDSLLKSVELLQKK